MSKKNGRGPDIGVQSFRDETLSSGVKVTILPFPARLYDNIQRRGLEKFPEPVPPKKIIKVAGGTEEVDDVNNSDYLIEKDRAKAQREKWIGERFGETTLDFCVQVDLAPWEATIEKIEKAISEPAPTDPDERRNFFLTNFALRGRADYERVTSTAMTLMAVGDSEITERMESFRSEMERSGINNAQASGANEVKRLDMEQP